MKNLNLNKKYVKKHFNYCQYLISMFKTFRYPYYVLTLDLQ